MNICMMLKVARSVVAVAALAFSAQALAGADMIATKIRVSNGSGPSAAQIDLFNRGFSDAIGSSVNVSFPELGFGINGLKLYQYYGGTATTAYTVRPNQLGYLTFSLPAGVYLPHGTLVHARIASADPTLINAIDTFFYACLKSTVGCE